MLDGEKNKARRRNWGGEGFSVPSKGNVWDPSCIMISKKKKKKLEFYFLELQFGEINDFEYFQ